PWRRRSGPAGGGQRGPPEKLEETNAENPVRKDLGRPRGGARAAVRRSAPRPRGDEPAGVRRPQARRTHRPPTRSHARDRGPQRADGRHTGGGPDPRRIVAGTSRDARAEL